MRPLLPGRSREGRRQLTGGHISMHSYKKPTRHVGTKVGFFSSDRGGIQHLKRDAALGEQGGWRLESRERLRLKGNVQCSCASVRYRRPAHSRHISDKRVEEIETARGQVK
jgi:hypothetical protein